MTRDEHRCAIVRRMHHTNASVRGRLINRCFRNWTRAIHKLNFPPRLSLCEQIIPTCGCARSYNSARGLPWVIATWFCPIIKGRRGASTRIAKVWNRCELSREKSKRAPRPRLRCICRPLSARVSAFQSNGDWVSMPSWMRAISQKEHCRGWEIAAIWWARKIRVAVH